MLVLAAAGVSPSEYRIMHPDLADQLTARALELRAAEGEARVAELEYIGEHIAAVIKSVGSLQRGLRAVQDTIARRPSL